MPISFPLNPTQGQTYTYNGNTWTWDGAGWEPGVAIELPCHHQLPGIRHAGNALSLRLGLAQGGQKHPGEDRDDGDDDEKLDEGESRRAAAWMGSGGVHI